MSPDAAAFAMPGQVEHPLPATRTPRREPPSPRGGSSSRPSPGTGRALTPPDRGPACPGSSGGTCGDLPGPALGVAVHPIPAPRSHNTCATCTAQGHSAWTEPSLRGRHVRGNPQTVVPGATANAPHQPIATLEAWDKARGMVGTPTAPRPPSRGNHPHPNGATASADLTP